MSARSSSTSTKSAAAFRTISEVSDHLQVPQHVLRFWETKFDAVRPMKRGGGRRYYRPEDIELLRRIRDLLYSDGYTIKGVQKLLREGQISARPPAAAAGADTARSARNGRHGAGGVAAAMTAADGSQADGTQGGGAPAGGPGAGSPGAGETPAAAGATSMLTPTSVSATGQQGEQAAEGDPGGDGGGLSPADRAALQEVLDELLALREMLRDNDG